ncbi:LTA synthase family protein [Clostridium thermarum]|uniref:LTA synthase family protein n=1 Tax=Clostridium thermarum TaxID=1716543 RepID=UPI0013D02F56|nr:LTA synthase family protein [Clostridium thermarum]
MNISLRRKLYSGVYRNLKPEPIVKLRTTILFVVLAKTIIFLALLESTKAKTLKWTNVSFEFWYVYLSFALLIFSFGYLFPKGRQIKFYLIFDILYTVLLVADLWYFRVNRDFLGLKNIVSPGTFNPLKGSLFNAQSIDIIFVPDIIFLVLWIKLRDIKNSSLRDTKKFGISLSIAIIGILISYSLINVVGISSWHEKLFKKGWTPLMSVRAPGPIGYHLYEGYTIINRAMKPTGKEDMEEIKQWLSQNKEGLPDNEYKGIFQGKNVIFLQLESFENFILNRVVNGKEITPFINKLAREGLYFNNIYQQNNGGNSIDCDLMVNTSIFPLGECITATNYGEVVYPKSLARILKNEGYTTVATHGDYPAEFNWTELHRNGFGVDIIWDVYKYRYEERVGYGLSDRSFLSQLSDKMKELPQPFYVHAPTMSNHGPYKIDKKYRVLNLPKEIDESYLGGYFESALYTDKQVEMFINRLDRAGILDNTVVVLYGDHAGVHKYYNEDIQKLSFDGDWWKEYDQEIPLIIYAKGIEPAVIETYGGQTDIMPTVLYMLGVEDSKYRDHVMGRILVNTNRNAVVIKGNEIKGEVKSEEEKEHLLKSYDIGSKLIKNGGGIE